MEHVILCTGKYAEKPYYFEKLCTRVYCVEELCYLLAANPFLIDASIMDKELAQWLYEECDCKDLAGELLRLLQRGCQASIFVDAIMDATGYCSKEEREKIAEVLKGNAGLDRYERRVKQGDYLLNNGKYQLACKEYERLLAELPKSEQALLPMVYHNLGVSFCRMFQFENGAACLKRAYELSGSEDSGVQYLEALREQMPENDYIAFIADHREYYALSLKVEKYYEMARSQFEATRENRMLSALKIYKEEGNTASYYEEIDKIIDGLKESYRESVS